MLSKLLLKKCEAKLHSIKRYYTPPDYVQGRVQAGVMRYKCIMDRGHLSMPYSVDIAEQYKLNLFNRIKREVHERFKYTISDTDIDFQTKVIDGDMHMLVSYEYNFIGDIPIIRW